MGATCVSNKELLEKMPIYRATENLITLQIMQPVCIIWMYLRYFEGPDPQAFKLVVISFVLLWHVPFKNQISQLEILLTFLPVKGLLDYLLTVMRSVYHLFPGRLHFYQLMYPSNHIIKLFLVVLEEFCYRQGKVRRKIASAP
jgi:hypothetical protein